MRRSRGAPGRMMALRACLFVLLLLSAPQSGEAAAGAGAGGADAGSVIFEAAEDPGADFEFLSMTMRSLEPADITAFEKALEDHDIRTRSAAVELLGNLRHPDVPPLLVRALRDVSEKIRESAVQKLIALKGLSVEALAGVLGSEEYDTNALHRAVFALGRIGAAAAPAIATGLRPLREDYDPAAAADLLVGFGKPSVGPLLRASEEEECREIAGRTLARLNPEVRSEGLREIIFAASERSGTKLAAMGHLLTPDPGAEVARSFEPVLWDILRDASTPLETKVRAAKVGLDTHHLAGYFGPALYGDGNLRSVAAALPDTHGERVYLSLLDALTGSGDRDGQIGAAKVLLKHDFPARRYKAIEARASLTKYRDNMHPQEEQLIALMGDSELIIRKAAVVAYGDIVFRKAGDTIYPLRQITRTPGEDQELVGLAEKSISQIENRSVDRELQLEDPEELKRQKQAELLDDEAGARDCVPGAGESDLGVEWVLIPGGEYTVGGQDDEASRMANPERVVVLRDFYLSRHEVTQAQWTRVMGENPSNFGTCECCPVESVSWEEVQDFIREASSITWLEIRLPTEAEWEVAAAGGDLRQRWSGTDDESMLEEYAWLRENTNSTRFTHISGEKKANRFGLSDMSGNVMEWCQDWSGQLLVKHAEDPRGPDQGTMRIIRGGSFMSIPKNATTFSRSSLVPEKKRKDLGFRLARDAE